MRTSWLKIGVMDPVFLWISGLGKWPTTSDRKWNAVAFLTVWLSAFFLALLNTVDHWVLPFKGVLNGWWVLVSQELGLSMKLDMFLMLLLLCFSLIYSISVASRCAGRISGMTLPWWFQLASFLWFFFLVFSVLYVGTKNGSLVVVTAHVLIFAALRSHAERSAWHRRAG
jgi:hypothetical protein